MAWIFLVGPAAAGKTTFCRLLQAIAPQFSSRSDVEALLELASLQSDNQRHGKTSRFWPEFFFASDSKCNWIRGAIQPLDATSFEIVNPKIWDEALLRSVRDVVDKDDVVFEFSRGTDRDYCTAYGVEPEAVYHRSFAELMHSFPELGRRQLSIVHLAAPFDERCARNRARANAGERFVAHDAFQRLYEKDTFRFIPSSPGASTGILSRDLPLPVYSIANIGTQSSALHLFEECIARLTQSPQT